jgi:hypothetical protein
MFFELQEKFISLLAIALLVGFFGIIGWWIWEIDLIIVLAFATGLAIYDFFFHNRSKASS